MQVKGFRAVVFDFDFTLADASAGIIPAVNGALQDIGQPQMDERSVRAIIGLSLPEVLRELTGIAAPPELVETFASRFIARADSLESDSANALSVVLPGVTAALEALRTSQEAERASHAEQLKQMESQLSELAKQAAAAMAAPSWAAAKSTCADAPAREEDPEGEDVVDQAAHDEL